MKEVEDGQQAYETTDGGLIWADTNNEMTYYLNQLDSDGCETAEGMTKVEMAGLVADMAELLGAPEDALWLLKQHVGELKMQEWHDKVGEDLSGMDLESLDRMARILYKVPFTELGEDSGQVVLNLFRAAQGEV